MRVLYGRYPIGSHLFGGATDSSDRDYLNLWFPTTEEQVGNRRVVIPSEVTETEDHRHLLLGEFVMSIGHDPENTLTAFQYEPFNTGWMFNRMVRTSTAERLWTSGQKMMRVAAEGRFVDKPKQLGHAFRYVNAAVTLWVHGAFPRYPFKDEELEVYLEMRKGYEGAHPSARALIDSYVTAPSTLREYFGPSEYLSDTIDRKTNSVALWVRDIYSTIQI